NHTTQRGWIRSSSTNSARITDRGKGRDTMQLMSGALALGLFNSGSSKLIVIVAAVVVVLAIVVVSIMVLRSDSGDSKVSRGLAYEVDEGPAGGSGSVSKRRDSNDG